MSDVLGTSIKYTDPSVKEFKQFMLSKNDVEFINVIIGVHFPTKLGLAKGIKFDYEKVTGQKPTNIRKYIEDFKENWI